MTPFSGDKSNTLVSGFSQQINSWNLNAELIKNFGFYPNQSILVWSDGTDRVAVAFLDDGFGPRYLFGGWVGTYMLFLAK